MSEISASLDKHHAQIDDEFVVVLRAARAADWSAFRTRFAVLRAAVQDHIAYAEQELFPEIARVLGSDVELLSLRAEHDRLRRHFDTLGAAAPEYDPQGCMGELEDLSAFIQKHHLRELEVCYPALDRLPGVARDSAA